MIAALKAGSGKQFRRMSARQESRADQFRRMSARQVSRADQFRRMSARQESRADQVCPYCCAPCRFWDAPFRRARRKQPCPHCHLELPRTAGRVRHLAFSLVGAREAGKSHYLAVLVEQIRKHVGPRLDLLLAPLDHHTIERYRRDFHEPVFQRKTVIRGAAPAPADPRSRRPLVYSLTFSGQDLLGRRTIRGLVTISFFDISGEDLASAGALGAVGRIIHRADGVIVLLDPLQLPAVRDRLAASVPLPARASASADILERTTDLIRAGCGLPPAAMISIPLAVALAKFDAVEPLVDPQLQVSAEPRHHRGFDLADFHAVDAEMQSLLVAWEGLSPLHHLETHYRRFGFFGLSALGCNPHGDQKIPRVLPWRVEDPFLWLLHCHGLIPTAQRGRRARTP